MGEEDGAERTDRQAEATDHDGSSVHATGRNVNRSRSDEFWRGTGAAGVQRSPLLDRIADRNGIQRVNIGALRHSFGTWAKQFGKEIRPAADGIPLATIAAIMAHNAKTNADFYQEAVSALALIPINLVHRDDPQPEQDRRAVGA